MSDDCGWDEESPVVTEIKPRSTHPYNFDDFNGESIPSYTLVSEHDDRTVIMINTRHVGKVIGKGGCQINQIRETTNSNIYIERRSNTYQQTTKIDVVGDKDAREKAVQMISDICNDTDKKNFDPRTNYKPCSWNRKDDDSSKSFQGFNSGRQRRSPEPSPFSKEQNNVKFDWGKVIEDSTAALKARWESLASIVKDFYKETTEVANFSEETVKEIRQNLNNISVIDHEPNSNQNVPNPITTFEQAFHPYDEIMDVIRSAGFTKPTPIQCQAWPILLSGRDLIGIAQTGTGKTLAFLLPALIHIDSQPIPREERVGPTCLILSPTRELAKQIEEEVNKFNFRGIRSCCIYGGADRRAQISLVENGVEIVIATPGRLNDLYMNKIISLDSVSFLVLDEADRMLDMGFEAEIKKVLLDIRPDRHTVMTSATWPQQVRRLASVYMNNPIQVNVGSLDLTTCHTVTQHIEFLDGDDKFERICKFVATELDPEDKVIIFVGRKITADYLSTEFIMKDILPGQVQCIHGDREQYDREEAISEFKAGIAKVLIATDVASRGLDINNVTCVVNYDFPRHIEEYVHRIGRTGRAGKHGRSLTFMTKEDWSRAQSLVDLLKEANQNIPNDLIAMAERYAENRRQRELEQDSFIPNNGKKSFGRPSNFRGGGDNNRPRQHSRGGCFKCGKFGHMSRECPEA